jgi:hypothetical protein
MPKLRYLEFVEAQRRIPRGTAGIWAVMLELDSNGPWSVRDVWLRTQENPGTVHQYLRPMLAAGIAIRVGERMMGGKNPQPAPLYRLTQRPLEMPRLYPDGSPKPERICETLWRTIKMAKSFMPEELAELASREGRPINVNTVHGYCNMLTHAGVLKRTFGPNRKRRYTLIMNVGAKSPRVLESKIVYDPNSQKVLGEICVREVES